MMSKFDLTDSKLQGTALLKTVRATVYLVLPDARLDAEYEVHHHYERSASVYVTKGNPVFLGEELAYCGYTVALFQHSNHAATCTKKDGIGIVWQTKHRYTGKDIHTGDFEKLLVDAHLWGKDVLGTFKELWNKNPGLDKENEYGQHTRPFSQPGGEDILVHYHT